MKIDIIQHLSPSEGAQTIIVPVGKGADMLTLLRNRFGISEELASQLSDDFEGKLEEVLPVYLSNESISKVILLGTGEFDTYQGYRESFKILSHKYHKLLNAAPVLFFNHLKEHDNFLALVEGAVTGMIHGTYSIGLYKSEKSPEKKRALRVLIDDVAKQSQIKEVCQTGVNTALSQLRIFDLVNAPSNYKTPAAIANWAQKSGQEYGYKVTVFDDQRINDEKLAALFSVSRGSANPARFIITEYKKGDNLPVIALVGKGVTFDTGGLSIKRSRNMHYMKSDMGGAAAVLGAMELVAREQLKAHVIGFLPCTENSVDAHSTKPGDVINSYSGKTIEVIDTDAEGRLILADALSYAVRNYSPDYLIDMATLTGNVISALGTYCSGLYTPNDTLADLIQEAGQKTGERLWRLPLWKEYGEEMQSDIADLRNLSDKPMAGSITAAAFLEAFTDEHPNWAHMDIAGTAFKANGISKYYSATGFGIKLLVEVIGRLATSDVLPEVLE